MFLIISGVLVIVGSLIWVLIDFLKKKRGFKKQGWFFLLGAIMLIVGGLTGNFDSNDAKPAHHLTEKEKEAKIEAKARIKNEKEHYRDLKKDLAKLPQKTKGEITGVKVKKADGIVHIGLMLSDKFDSMGDEELKPNVKNAWQIGVNEFNKFSPFQNGSNYDVQVFDSSGNVIGTTGTFSNDFKYKG